MADIYFKCVCGKSLAVDENGVGQTVLCVDCGQPVEVLEPEIEFACESCQTVLLALITDGGDRIKCTTCGQCMIVPRLGIDIKPMWADPLGRSGFQVRRRTKPEPASYVSGWYQSGRLIIGTVAAVLLLAAGAILAYRFIPEFKESPKEKTIAQKANDKPLSLQVADNQHNQPAGNSAKLTEKPGKAIAVSSVKNRPAKKSLPMSKPAIKEEVINVAKVAATPALSRPTQVMPAKASADTASVKNIIYPAKQLLDECNEAKTILQQNPTDKKDAVLIGKIKKCRKNVLEYTRTHMGSDLDGPNWMNAVKGILWLSSYREWNTFEEADRAMREAFDILAEAEPEKQGLNITAMFYTILMHEQVWHKQAPEKCAEWLDKACELTFDEGNAELAEKLLFFAPGNEIDLIFAASILPLERRKAFQAKRERNLLGYLNNEDISLDKRTRDLWWWTVNLKTVGQMEKAAKLLDAWQKKYDRRIETPVFFEERMLIAMHGDGDWEKAREMLGRIRQLVKKGIVPEDNWSWNNMTSKYYKYILVPEYEIKRQYWIEYFKNAQRT